MSLIEKKNKQNEAGYNKFAIDIRYSVIQNIDNNVKVIVMV